MVKDLRKGRAAWYYGKRIAAVCQWIQSCLAMVCVTDAIASIDAGKGGCYSKYLNFFQKKSRFVWLLRKKAVPLQPQFGNEPLRDLLMMSKRMRP